MDESDTPIRLLSFDSGDARGLAELFTLRELMARVNMRRRQSDGLKPWQLFDLIAGTSTGGLIALMLGRLHMSVDECISAYMDYSKATHEPKRAKWNAFMTPPSRSTPAEQIIQDIVRKRRASYPTFDVRMRNPASPCKVIGAGAAPRNKFSGELGASIEAVARASAHAEGIAHTFELQQTGTSMESSLYRFSAPTLANIGLEEHDAVADIEAATQSYLRSIEMQDPLRRCVDDLEINSEENSDAVKQFEAQRAYELELQEFAEWLFPLNMSVIQDDNIAKLQKGTGTSLLRTSSYQSWVLGGTKTLLCIGEVGSGKTIFASRMIDILLSDRGYKRYPVLYYFANIDTHWHWQQAKKQTPASVLANLLKQLIYHNRHISDRTRRFVERHIKGGKRPTAEGLLSCIEQETMGTPKIFVVIDALDDLAYSCREELLGYLCQLHRKCTMSLVVTSRPNSEINHFFAETFPGYRSLEIRQSQEDVEAYLVGQMHRLPNVVMRDMKLQHHIMTEIMSLSHGVFLVAKLLVESLIGKVTIREIKSTLSSLPHDLHAIYEAMFKRVEEQDQFSRDLAFKALAWACYAGRPLTALELQHALAVETGKGSLDVENLIDIEELISVCGGFLAVTAESKLITFIHTTAEKYFEGHRNPQMAIGEFAIASTCLTYLCFDCFADGRCDDDEALQQRLTKHPFLDYASRFWGNHTREVPWGELTGEFDDLALKLLTHDGKVSTCSQIMLLPDGHTPYSSETTPEVISGLHLAAYFDIEWLARLLLKPGLDICVRDSWGRDPLAWAVAYNIPRTARFLLNSEADIELKDNQGRTHLALAATCGFINMANELLRRGADPSARDSTGQNALSLAASHGRLSLVQDFLGEPDIEVDSRDDLGRTPLLCAADQGHEDVVACLAAQASVDINTQNNMGETPLIASARRGWIGVVHILLEQDSILPNLKDRSGRTAVMWAVMEGQIEVLQLLLSREDAIEALKSTDLSGKSPLYWAINGNNVPI